MVNIPQTQKRILTSASKSLKTELGFPEATTEAELKKGLFNALPEFYAMLEAIGSFNTEQARQHFEDWTAEAESFTAKRKSLRATATTKRRVSNLSDEEAKIQLRELAKRLGVSEIKV